MWPSGPRRCWFPPAWLRVLSSSLSLSLSSLSLSLMDAPLTVCVDGQLGIGCGDWPAGRYARVVAGPVCHAWTARAPPRRATAVLEAAAGLVRIFIISSPRPDGSSAAAIWFVAMPGRWTTVGALRRNCRATPAQLCGRTAQPAALRGGKTPPEAGPVPGNHIPIVDETRLRAAARQVILPWNLCDEVAAQLDDYMRGGAEVGAVSGGGAQIDAVLTIPLSRP